MNNIAIENVYPEIDNGLFYAKKTINDRLDVYADIFKAGTDKIKPYLLYRKKGNIKWDKTEMEYLNDDRWHGSFILDEIGIYEYKIIAWTDIYITVLKKLESWYRANESIKSDLFDIINILKSIEKNSLKKDRDIIEEKINLIKNSDDYEAINILNGDKLKNIVLKYQEKKDYTEYKSLYVFSDRKIANFSSWYELFPRSYNNFKGVENQLTYIKNLGFDVLYLTPIHPVGITSRRGKNGSRTSDSGDPGSPWAIGSSEGGHYSIDKHLGTFDDFDHLLKKAKSMGIEIAMDLAYQCSPDHPYVKDHSNWFYKRPDGTIRYAENPPKKYYDIFPLNFDTVDKKNLYSELKNIIVFWIKKGIRIFRVDNPHTKPFSFWSFVMKSIKNDYPDVVFLAEAFTREKIMYELSKIGFSMSYTYFTWVNTYDEIKNYFNKLYSYPYNLFFRPMLFTNTPDILPESLKNQNSEAFITRSLLAGTLSPLWGIYSGFETCENTPLNNNSEEYLNSEKYEIKNRDFTKPGNIGNIISKLNKIRIENDALKTFNLIFCDNNNKNIISYLRYNNEKTNIIIVVINLDINNIQCDIIKIPLKALNINETATYDVIDLLDNSKYTWHGEYNYVRLIPGYRNAHILKVLL